jgi:hypothetical protein
MAMAFFMKSMTDLVATTQPQKHYLGRRTEQASIGLQQWQMLKISSADAPIASSSASSHMSQLIISLPYHHPGCSHAGALI